jgi:hypothetical protein
MRTNSYIHDEDGAFPEAVEKSCGTADIMDLAPEISNPTGRPSA